MIPGQAGRYLRRQRRPAAKDGPAEYSLCAPAGQNPADQVHTPDLPDFKVWKGMREDRKRKTVALHNFNGDVQ